MAFGAPKPSGGLRGLRGAFGGLWWPRFPPLKPFRVPAGLGGPPGASGVPPGASGGPRRPVGASEGLYPCLADPEISAPPGRPRTPPRTPLGRFPGRSRTPGPWRASRKPENPGLQACEPWTLGLVAGFASFWAPSLTGPKLSAFPSHFQGGLAGSGLMPPQQNAEGQGRWV